jgi:hypothetical protein
MVLATLTARVGVLEYRKSGARRNLILLDTGHGKKAEEVWSDDTKSKSKELVVVLIAAKLGDSESSCRNRRDGQFDSSSSESLHLT